MTKPYRPSNGTEGEFFMARFCYRCTWETDFRRDPGSNDGCSILAYTFAYDIDDPNYPEEWIEEAAGPRCLSFEQVPA